MLNPDAIARASPANAALPAVRTTPLGSRRHGSRGDACHDEWPVLRERKPSSLLPFIAEGFVSKMTPNREHVHAAIRIIFASAAARIDIYLPDAIHFAQRSRLHAAPRAPRTSFADVDEQRTGLTLIDGDPASTARAGDTTLLKAIYAAELRWILNMLPSMAVCTAIAAVQNNIARRWRRFEYAEGILMAVSVTVIWIPQTAMK